MKVFDAIRARFKNAHPDHFTIARSMVLVSLFVLLGACAHAAKEVVIAYRYGVSAEVDAYLFIFNLVKWPTGVWFSVLTVVLVPLAARIRHGASTDIPAFRSELLGLTIMIGLTLVFLAWAGLPLLLRSPWIGLPSTTVDIASHIMPTLALLAPLGVLISLFSAWMLAAGRHTNTLLEGVPALVLLMVLLTVPGGGVEPLIWGTLAGFVFHLVSLATPMLRRGEIEAPHFTRKSPEWPVFWQGFGIMLAGQALMSLTVVVDQFFAANLGTGSISTLSYANQILALILGMGAMAVSRSTLPIFSQAQAQGGGQLHRVAAHWGRLLFVLGVVAMIFGWWLSPWGVKLLFERGAFTAEDTGAVTEVLRYGLMQLPFYFASLVLVSLLVSKGKYRAIATVASLNFVVKVVANLVFVKWLGLSGIVLATSFMYMVSMSLCWLAVRRAI